VRREWLDAAAVLVPFALLVAAGFWFTRPSPPGADVPRGESIVLQPREAPPKPAVVAPHDAGAPPSAPAVDSAPVREDLREVVATTAPRVRRCLQDEDPRGGYEVKVRFTRQGVRVETQNPWLSACVEDVFEEVAWHPGPDFAPAEHTFSFDGPKD
jgi:hypothetical protein